MLSLAEPAAHTRRSDVRYFAASTALAARMMVRMQFLHAFARNVRIDLCSGEIAVAQQHLHDAQICAVIEQMCGKSVS